MNVSVPSLEPGASSLPAELRIPRGDIDIVHGLDRLRMGQRTLGMAGISCDENGVCVSDGVGDNGSGDWGYQPVYQPAESPYPVVYSSPSPGQPAQPIDYNALIQSGILSLAQLTAIQQGGSIKTANGTIYGSSAASVVAAGNPGATLNVGGSSAMLSSPLMIMGIGLFAIFMLQRGK